VIFGGPDGIRCVDSLDLMLKIHTGSNPKGFDLIRYSHGDSSNLDVLTRQGDDDAHQLWQPHLIYARIKGKEAIMQ
jgi:hypothetical protein